MPRDGSNIYSQPFPDVEEGTTIESTVYNGFTNDVAQDLNEPRPISSGGTGADNAVDAMVNLGGETSKVEVTNYDSHPFAAGSFYSKTTATNPPVAGHAFAGYCYVAVISGVATSDMFIEVRDRDEPVQPGSQYVRQKKAGVWSAWLKPVGTASGTTPPTPASSNALWWDPTRGKLFIYYVDADTSQWVEAVAIPDVNADEVENIVGTRAVLYDAAQTLTSTQQAQARANIAVTKKNYIINGAMQISQEQGTTLLSLGLYYPADQFFGVTAGWASGWPTAQWVTSPTPGGSTNRIRIAVPTAHATVAVAEHLKITQTLEGLRAADLRFGSAAAKTVTLQFGCKGPAGTYCVSLVNYAGNRSYVAEYVISAGQANTDIVVSVTFPGDTAGTWVSDNTGSIVINWVLTAGSNYQQAAGAWSATGAMASPGISNFTVSTSNVFELFDVSLTEGSVAPPFQVPDYASELLACQRYFSTTQVTLRFMAAGANATECSITWPVQMRSAPVAVRLTNQGVANAQSGGGTVAGSPTVLGARFSILPGGAGDCYVIGQIISANARL